MFQTKVVEKIKTYFRFNKFFFFKNRSFYGVMSKNMVQTDTPHMTLQNGA